MTTENNKKAFISYRRALSNYPARTVYQYLKEKGYDVFMDVENLDSGEFSPVIFNQIKARPHFLIILEPDSLKRTTDPEDWLRREIEYALKTKRNIVPILIKQFDFKVEEKKLPGNKLPGELGKLKNYNGLDVPDNFFSEAMAKLTNRFLKKRVDVSITAPPKSERKTVDRMIKKADQMVNRLPAPKIRVIETSDIPDELLLKGLNPPYLGWKKITFASGYVVQRSIEKSFGLDLPLTHTLDASGKVLGFGSRLRQPAFPPLLQRYRELPTSDAGFVIISLAELIERPWNPGFPKPDFHYYRVKATATFDPFESLWSNIVKVKPPTKRYKSDPDW